jgi:hypothetical protein
VEGKMHGGAEGRRESTSAMGGGNATQLTTSGNKAARTRSRREAGTTKVARYKQAAAKGIEGRSKMSKRQLKNALQQV